VVGADEGRRLAVSGIRHPHPAAWRHVAVTVLRRIVTEARREGVTSIAVDDLAAAIDTLEGKK
jgi:hypothetical protein